MSFSSVFGLFSSVTVFFSPGSVLTVTSPCMIFPMSGKCRSRIENSTFALTSVCPLSGTVPLSALTSILLALNETLIPRASPKSSSLVKSHVLLTLSILMLSLVSSILAEAKIMLSGFCDFVTSIIIPLIYLLFVCYLVEPGFKFYKP